MSTNNPLFWVIAAVAVALICIVAAIIVEWIDTYNEPTPCKGCEFPCYTEYCSQYCKDQSYAD